MGSYDRRILHDTSTISNKDEISQSNSHALPSHKVSRIHYTPFCVFISQSDGNIIAFPGPLGWLSYSLLGSFWVVSSRSKSLQNTEATEATRYDRRFPYGCLRYDFWANLVWNILIACIFFQISTQQSNFFVKMSADHAYSFLLIASTFDLKYGVENYTF